MKVSLLIAVALAQVVSSGDADRAIEVAIVASEHQERTVSAWRLQYNLATRADILGSNGQLGQQETRFWELRSGDRYHRRSSVKTGDGSVGVNGVTEDSFDGKEFRRFSPDENFGKFSSQGGVDGSYVEFVYLSTQPLSEILKDVRSKGNVQWSRADGRRTLECVITESSGLVRTMHLDPSNGWQPWRIVTNQAVPTGRRPDGQEYERLTARTKSFLKKDGIVLPSDVQIAMEAIGPGERRRLLNDRRFELTSLEVNPVVADSDFTIRFPNGTTVADIDRDVGYIEGVPDSEYSRRSASSRGAIGSILAPPGTEWIWWADRRLWLACSGTAFGFLSYLFWRKRRLGQA